MTEFLRSGGAGRDLYDEEESFEEVERLVLETNEDYEKWYSWLFETPHKKGQTKDSKFKNEWTEAFLKSFKEYTFYKNKILFSFVWKKNS